MAVLRELLPVPHSGLGASKVAGVSRSVARRVQQRLHKDLWENEILATLNGLYTGSEAPPPLGLGSSSQQLQCTEHVKRAVAAVGKPDADINPTGAFTELCGTDPGYAAELGPTRPYMRDLVSLPPAGCRPVDPGRLLSGECLDKWLNWQTKILRDPVCVNDSGVEPRVLTPYSDPFVKDKQAYGAFISDLVERGIVSLRSKRKRTVGIFFVAKSNGRLRLIFDTRVANTHFRAPDHTSLPSGATFGGVEVDSSQQLHVGELDVADAFYRIALPEELGNHFVLPSVPVQHLTAAARRQLSAEEWLALGDVVSPCMLRLPMGWNWAVHSCQKCVEAAVLQGGLGDVDKLQDKQASRPLEAGEIRHAEYVDNVVVLGTSADVVNAALRKAAQTLNDLDLTVHEPEWAATSHKALGLHFNANAVSVGPRRLWKLRMAGQEILRRDRVSGLQLRRFLGHATWAALLRREVLSVFSTIYAFCDKANRGPCRLWNSVRQELSWFIALLPLLSCQLDRKWSSVVTATDSSDAGYGVCYAKADPEALGAAGRLAERWRFQVDSCIRARASALAAVRAEDPLALDVASMQPLEAPVGAHSCRLPHLRKSPWGSWRAAPGKWQCGTSGISMKTS